MIRVCWLKRIFRFKWLTCVEYGGYVLILLVRKIIESAFFLLFAIVAAHEIEGNSNHVVVFSRSINIVRTYVM